MRKTFLNTKQTRGSYINDIAKKAVSFSLKGVFGIAVLTMFSCCGRPPKSSSDQPAGDTLQIMEPITYNIYVENSGSLKGYFNGNSTAKVIIKEYYDRINQSLNNNDTITLNYINEKIKPISEPIDKFLTQIQGNCSEQYSKIDDVLNQAISKTNNKNVQIVISDYCFTSNSGDFKTAQSGITSIFYKKLKNDKKFSVLIKKYNCDFSGKYYPGGIQYKGQRPIYIWIMGHDSILKSILDLDIKEESKTLCLQKNAKSIQAEIKITQGQSKRMLDGNSIIVKEWKAERNDSKKYILNFELDLSKLLVENKLVLDPMNYENSSNYVIEDIKEQEDGKYSFCISTAKPSPGSIDLKYVQEVPSWVNSSNYEEKGIPKQDQTLGIKSLISGAYDAFYPKGQCIVFSSSITIK